MRLVWSVFAAIVLLSPAQHPLCQTLSTPADTDADGLSDALEQQLLDQFAPRFMVARNDCSGVPAEFVRNLSVPTVQVEDGTIYGQAFPAKAEAGRTPSIELHYYHLWRKDCGEHGHPLDTEHVAVLVQASQSDLTQATWKAIYWYAAAHEQTVCDVSQIARASTLRAEDKGAEVWISPGKHASYFDARLCNRGCGADRCEGMVPLHTGSVINLGEPGHLMNASLFASSSAWPLASKMEHSNFPAEPIGRLERLPATEIAWFRSGRHPAQGVVAISSSTEGAIAEGAEETESALSTASDSTSDAISVAGNSTGSALGKSYRKTKQAFGSSAKHVGSALRLSKKPAGEPQK